MISGRTIRLRRRPGRSSSLGPDHGDFIPPRRADDRAARAAVIVLCGCLISLRPARDAWLLPHADVAGQRLGSRRVRLGARDPEHPVGRGPTASPARSRTVSAPRACCAPAGFSMPIGLALMAYSTTPGMLDLAAGVCIGFGLAGCSFAVVLARFRQAAARELAAARLRRRHRGRLVRTVPLLAAGGFAHRRLRLAEHACDLRRRHAAGAAAVARARHRARAGGRLPGRRVAVARAGAGGGVRPPLLCPARARLLHLRLPARLHHRPHAGLSGRPRPFGGKSAAGPSR